MNKDVEILWVQLKIDANEVCEKSVDLFKCKYI